MMIDDFHILAETDFAHLPHPITEWNILEGTHYAVSYKLGERLAEKILVEP
jgi:hypothetical protein